jgi:hypothetical protein
VPEKSKLLFKDQSDDTRDKLVWKFTKGSLPASQMDFADPTDATGYALCLYDVSGLKATFFIPPGTSTWRTLGSKGYRYRENSGTASGVQKVKLKGGDEPIIVVKGKGMNLPDGVLPISVPVTVQLRNLDSGRCWEDAYSTTGSQQFKGKNP